MNGPALLRRAATAFIASTILGALLATGLALPATAAETHNLTVTVRNVTGTPLAGMSISAIAVADGVEITGDSLPNGSYPTAKAVTGKPGVYTFTGLGDFDHTLYFATPTSTTFAQLLGGASDIARAQVIPSGQSSISVSLATNSVITGIVTTPAKKVLPKALVTAYFYSGSDWIAYSSARADAKGRYYLRDLDPGSYRLKFGGAANDYSPWFSGGSSTLAAASAVNVGVGQTATVNAQFPTGTGSITGVAEVDCSAYVSGYCTAPMAKAIAIAIPVTVAADYPYKVTPQLEGSVSSLPSAKNGLWTIKNLKPGKYIVKISPAYYNQYSTYLGYPTIAYASVFTVGAGKLVKTGRTDAYETPRGGSLTVTVRAPGGAVVPGAQVQLQSDAEPGYYLRATTSAAGTVVFGKSGKEHTIQPGEFTLSVLTDGTWAPLKTPHFVYAGAHTLDVSLTAPVAAAGFVTAPSIAESSLIVGTRYVVAAQPRRGTSALSYQWLRNGHPVFGADEAAYTSRAGDIGAQLSVRVTSQQYGYKVDTATASVAGLVAPAGIAPTNVTSPSITPSAGAHVGTTLRVLPGTWSVAGLTFSYAWSRNGEPFAHAGGSYVVQESDLNAEFTAVVTASKTGYTPATADAAGVTPVFAEATEITAAPTVTVATLKTPKGAKKYTAKSGTWTALAPTFSYEWLRGGVVVGTGPTLIEKPTATLLAKTLEVRVTANAPGFGPGTAVALARKSSRAIALTGGPAVKLADGTAVAATTPIPVGQTVAASGAAWTPVDSTDTVTFGYQWLRKVGKAKPVKIVGAATATYTAKAADVGALLSVTVTARSARTGNAVATVAAGKVVTRSGLADIAPTITLDTSTIVGAQIVSYFDSAWSDAGAKVTFQWYGCALPKCTAQTPVSKFTAIPKATRPYYAPATVYTKGRVYLAITATKAGFTTARATSSIVTVSPKTVIPVLDAPQLESDTGSAVIGGTVRFVSPRFGMPVTSMTNSWEVCVVDCLSSGAEWLMASGSATPGYPYEFYPDGHNWVNGTSYLRVTSTATRSGYPSVSTSSLPMQVVRGDLKARVGTSLTVGYNNAGRYSISRGWNFPSFAWVTQRWFVAENEVSSAATYSPTPDDAGKLLYAVVTVSAQGYDPIEVVVSASNVSTGGITSVPVTISGTKFGETLTLSDPEPFRGLPEWEFAQWSYRYQWDWSPGAVADGATYTPASGMIDRFVGVTIIADSPLFGHHSIRVQTPARLLKGDTLAFEEDVTLGWSGPLLAGTPVAASKPAYTEPGAETTYRWQTSADGSVWTDVAGTSQSYTPRLVDADRLLRVVVTATKDGYLDAVSTSDAVQILEGDVIRLLGAPAFTGDARVGTALTTTLGAWSTGTVPGVEWLLNGRVIPGATGATYVPLATNAGDEISVRVTGRQAGKLDVVAESAALTIRAGAAPTIVKAPVITGTTTLTATPGVWNVAGLTYGFEWLRDDAVIGTGETLVLQPGDTRAGLTLRVTATRFGYEPGVVTQ